MNLKDKSEKGLITLIDDDEAARLSIGQMLKLRGYAVNIFSSATDALSRLEVPETDCIISDIKMPGMDGEKFLEETRKRNLLVPVIMITGHGDVAMAVRCLKNGAYDFVEKPFDDDVLMASVARAVEKSGLIRESADLRHSLDLLAPEEDGRFGMLGKSNIMQDLYTKIEVFAKSESHVLILGETGSGKEMVARAIHAQSRRASGPFVAVNAGALPENMIESELFGHARGAFTGAEKDRDGKLIAASGGTLLLDEIESISEPAQIKLLRVLEDGLVEPLGKDKSRKVDIRLLTTTKENLKELVKKGRMREDFYHRIMVLTIIVPSLRERLEDIPLLLAYFIRQSAEKNGVPVPKINERTLAEVIRYQWPGNVRELKNTVERMVITAQNEKVIFSGGDEICENARLLSLPATQGLLRDELEKTEHRIIHSALQKNNGEINTTAAILGISRRALYERMKKYDLNKKDFRE